ncbi:MAG: nucleoside deaminase, partial [Burkholderiales bacterium]
AVSGARRRAIVKFGSLGLLAAALPARAANDKLPEIVQPATPTRAAFMERALEMRRLATERGDQPYGAVIVRGGRIVGEGVSAVITTPDPTAHAEMQAIRDAARRLRTRDLSGCEMYGTSRACPMCEAGAYWAGVARLWYGESIADGGAPRLR